MSNTSFQNYELSQLVPLEVAEKRMDYRTNVGTRWYSKSTNSSTVAQATKPSQDLGIDLHLDASEVEVNDAKLSIVSTLRDDLNVDFEEIDTAMISTPSFARDWDKEDDADWT